MFKNLLYLIILVVLLNSCDQGKSDKTGNSGEDTARIQLSQLNKEIEDDESNPDLYNKRARYYLDDRQFDPALNDINRAITLSPKKSEYFVTLSDIYLMMGQPPKASEALLKALEINPSDNNAILHLAKLNLIIREYKTAMEYINKSFQIEPVNNPQAHFLKAFVFLENGDTLSAVAGFKKTIELDQNNFDANMQLGELYALRKDRIAIDYYKNALRINPENTEVLYLLGMFYQETEQFEQALATYSSLERIDSTYKNASYNKGYIYMVYLQDYPKAIESFSKAIAMDPVYTEAWYNRGFAYELAGNYAKATENYKRTLELKVNYPKAIEALNRIDKIRVKSKN